MPGRDVRIRLRDVHVVAGGPEAREGSPRRARRDRGRRRGHRDDRRGAPARLRALLHTKEPGQGSGIGLRHRARDRVAERRTRDGAHRAGTGLHLHRLPPRVAPAASPPLPAAPPPGSCLLVVDDDAGCAAASPARSPTGDSRSSRRGRGRGDPLCGGRSDLRLVVTDAAFSGRGGARAIQALRASAPAARILVVSASGPPALDDEVAPLLEDVQVLAKPFSPEALVRTVREILAAAPRRRPSAGARKARIASRARASTSPASPRRPQRGRGHLERVVASFDPVERARGGHPGADRLQSLERAERIARPLNEEDRRPEREEHLVPHRTAPPHERVARHTSAATSSSSERWHPTRDPIDLPRARPGRGGRPGPRRAPRGAPRAAPAADRDASGPPSRRVVERLHLPSVARCPSQRRIQGEVEGAPAPGARRMSGGESSARPGPRPRRRPRLRPRGPRLDPLPQPLQRPDEIGRSTSTGAIGSAPSRRARATTFPMVNLDGSSLEPTSLHRRGTDTVARAWAAPSTAPRSSSPGRSAGSRGRRVRRARRATGPWSETSGWRASTARAISSASVRDCAWVSWPPSGTRTCRPRCPVVFG